MREIFDKIWAELMRPSVDQTPYERAVIFIAHGVLGACAHPLSAWGVLGAALVAAMYWLAKERGDVTRGGTIADGVEDTAAVAFGVAYGHPLWPFALLALGGFAMWRGFE